MARSDRSIELVTLAEPGARVWKETNELLRRVFRDRAQDPGIVLTGGTLLAGRWRHRESDDIDLKLPRWPDLKALAKHETQGRTLDRLLGAKGAVRTVQSDQHVGYRLGAGQLDLTAGRLWPDPHPQIVWIEGQRTWAASNAQVLSAKLIGRARHAPVRDLYDLAVAQDRDQEAAQTAVNALSTEELHDALDLWEIRREWYREQAKTRIRGWAQVHQPVMEDPGRHAIETVHELAWRRVELHYGPEGCTFVGERPGARRALGEPATTRTDLLQALMSLGAYRTREGLIVENEERLDRLKRAMAGEAIEPEVVKSVGLEGDLARTRAHEEARYLRELMDGGSRTLGGHWQVRCGPERLVLEWVGRDGSTRTLAEDPDAEQLTRALVRCGALPATERPERAQALREERRVAQRRERKHRRGTGRERD